MQHVFLSLTKVKPGRMWPLSQRFFLQKQTAGKGYERSVLLGCQVSAEDHGRPRCSTDSRRSSPSRWHPSLCTPRQSFAYLPIERMRVPRRAAKFYYRTLVCGIGPRGWMDEQPTVFERKEIRRSRGNAGEWRSVRRLWEMLWGEGEFRLKDVLDVLLSFSFFRVGVGLDLFGLEGFQLFVILISEWWNIL